MTQLHPFLPHLFTTLEHRPYVFCFLIVFLIFGIIQLGMIRTLLFLALGSVVAFSSEASSIRNGFPYGDYQYVYENLQGELLLWGVPLWDSLSYTFLAYASYSTATFISLSLQRRGSGRGLSKEEEFLKTRSSLSVLLMSILLMTGIDVVIDPLASLGDQWFLGRIYYYPTGGIYFGVPLSNFFGWALVAFTILFLFQLLDRTLEKNGNVLSENRWKGMRAYLGACLYLGVFLFNWAITLYLKQWALALADFVLIAPVFIFLMKKKTHLSINCASEK